MPMEEKPGARTKSGGLGVTLSLLILLGVGIWFWARYGSESSVSQPARVRSTLHLETFVLNLADTDQRSYLRVSLDLGLNQETKRGGDSAPVAQVRDTILSVLAEAKGNDLMTAAGKTKLKEQLLRALQERVPEIGVEEVYFTEFFDSALNAQEKAQIMAAAAQALPPAIEEKPGPGMEAEAEDLRWRPVLDLPCHLTVDLPLPHFSVTDFLALSVGSVIGTSWRLAHDVPVRVNGNLIGWAEFEGAGKRLAVRLTELA